MKQMTFADAEYAGKRKQTRKELFLIEMDRVVPWKGLIALVIPPFLALARNRGQAARANFCLGVMPPRAIFGLS